MDGPTGTVEATTAYDPWGNVTSSSGTYTPSFGYAGMFDDASTGLNLTLYRAYNPAQYRWASRDPLGEAMGANLYAYVIDSPTNELDHYGLQEDIPEPENPGEDLPVELPNPENSAEYQAVANRIKNYDPDFNFAAYSDLSWLRQVLQSVKEQFAKAGLCPANEPPPVIAPPGWNENWEWRYPDREGAHEPRWFDPQGGEWRWHDVDPWHPSPHWDYNPWTDWNSPWQNVEPQNPPEPPHGNTP